MSDIWVYTSMNTKEAIDAHLQEAAERKVGWISMYRRHVLVQTPMVHPWACPWGMPNQTEVDGWWRGLNLNALEQLRLLTVLLSHNQNPYQAAIDQEKSDLAGQEVAFSKAIAAEHARVEGEDLRTGLTREDIERDLEEVAERKRRIDEAKSRKAGEEVQHVGYMI